jgi:adenine-specific DNA-methyltransferase
VLAYDPGVIKYLGSKRKLLEWILEAIGPADGRTALDVFSGTARVGHALKGAGFRVLANDHNRYAFHLARTYVEADKGRWQAPAEALIAELNALPPAPGPFTATYCEQARYLHPRNGARVDAIRAFIDEAELDPVLESIALVALMEAADRVDSTCGVQMAFLKQWAARAHNDLELRLPAMLPRAAAGPGEAHQLEALDAARTLKADVAYLDPPYNQHSYLGNYHVWETLCRGDFPPTYGLAHKRVDVKERKSPFNSKQRCKDALAAVTGALDVEHLVVSFSDEGYLSHAELVALLERRGRVTSMSQDYKRYVGAQIGIHNPRGEKVGKVSHLKNKEHLFVVEVTEPPVRGRPEGPCGASAPDGQELAAPPQSG